VAKREALNRALKLWGGQTAWALPDRLPDLPAERPELGDVEAYAAAHSVAAYAGRADPAQFEAGATMRSQVREAYNRLLTAYDIARHQRDVVVPLTQTALGEMQLGYNAMLEDVYELLDATREQIGAGKEYVETLAEFWVARAELTQLLGGRLPEIPATTTAANQ
jgi:outer membrane protein TolC